MDSLKKQYEKLSNEEKSILLIYKSGLSELINNLDNNPDYEYYYNKYKERLNAPSNMFIRSIFFNYLALGTLDNFKQSIYYIKERLNEISMMMAADEDYTLFRLVTSKEPIHKLARGNIVSTSLSVGEAFKYDSGGSHITLFEIKLSAGSHVCSVPYKIKFDPRSKRMSVSADDEDEILLNQDIYEFEEEERVLSDGINYISLKAIDKLNKTRK